MADDAFAWKRDTKLQARLSAEVEALAKLPSNATCADCGDAKRIRFCSVTLGVFLCNRCYGLHRALGAHVTRGKCLGLDAWHPDEVNLLRSVGNAGARAQFEANVPAGVVRPTAASADRDVAAWIRDKYERKKYFGSSAAVAVELSDGASAASTSAASVPQQPSQRSQPPPPPPQPPPPPAAPSLEDLLGNLMTPASSAAWPPSTCAPTAQPAWPVPLPMAAPIAPMAPMAPMAAVPMRPSAAPLPTAAPAAAGGLSNDDILALLS